VDANDYYLKCEELRAKKEAERQDRLWDRAKEEMLENDELLRAYMDKLWNSDTFRPALIKAIRIDSTVLLGLIQEYYEDMLEFGEE
jgi:hypothetical protein